MDASKFTSSWFKQDCLEKPVEIKQVEEISVQKVGDKEQLCLHFVGETRPFGLNVSNTNMMISTHGKETDNWEGRWIVLYRAMVEFQGKQVPAVRLSPPGHPPKARIFDDREREVTARIPKDAYTIPNGKEDDTPVAADIDQTDDYGGQDVPF